MDYKKFYLREVKKRKLRALQKKRNRLKRILKDAAKVIQGKNGKNKRFF